MRSYVALNLTDGFVPDEELEELPGGPKNPRKWLKVLVECGKPLEGGGRGAGLVDEANGGWRLHDYLDHALPAEEVTRRKRESAARQRAWRDAKQTRTVTHNETRNDTHDATHTKPVANVSRARVLPSHPIPSYDLDLTGEREDLRASVEPKPERKPEPQSKTSPVSSNMCGMDELKRRLREEPTEDIERKSSQFLNDPYASTFDYPRLWPETQAMAACFADAYGAPHRRLGDLPRDKGLATLLSILSAGITCQEYFRAVTLSIDDEWFSKLKSPGLTTLTLEQVRRMLAEAEERGAA
jgi:hypothetical protein